MSDKNNKSPIIQAAVDHYQSKGIRSFRVDEWEVEGSPLVVYQKPMTVKDKAIYTNALKNDSYQEAMVVLIMRVALNADGKKLFNIGDRMWLVNNVDEEVISGIFLEISKPFEGQDALAEK